MTTEKRILKKKTVLIYTVLGSREDIDLKGAENVAF